IDDGRDGDYDANVCNGFFSRNYAALAKVTKFYAKILFLMVMKRLDDTSNMIIVWKKLGVVSVHHMHLLLLMKLSTNVQTLIVQIVCLFLFKEGQLSLISLNTDLDHPHLRLFTLELKDNSYHSLIKSYPALGQILEAVEANRLKD
ncbi:5438_t:CDS:2, partial [Rhizophagus irregularis]